MNHYYPFTMTAAALILLGGSGASAQELRTSRTTTVESYTAKRLNRMPERTNPGTLHTKTPSDQVLRRASDGGTMKGGGGNDQCANAVALNVLPPVQCANGATPGDNSNATQDGGVPSCDFTTTQFQDVWYYFNAGPNTEVTISFTIGTMQDLVVEVYQGITCAGPEVYCDIGQLDNVVAVQPNLNYMIRVSSNNDFGSGGTFTICVSAGGGGGYCAAGATSTAFEKIANVTYANINNSSTSTAGYEDFTSITANVVRGQTNNITVTISNGYPEDVVLVWIDLNQDQDFDDAGELMYTSPMGVGPHTGPITIPLTATLGNTRMRVRLHDSTLGANSTPCGNSTYGQVEDYTVNIQQEGGGTPPNDQCTGAVNQNLAPGSTITFSGNNTGATAIPGTNVVAVWEQFTTTTCTNVTINYCVPGSVFTDFIINLVTQCPDVLTGLLTGAFDDCTVTFIALPAGTYWIPVLVEAGATPLGPYTIQVSAVACPPGYCQAGATSTSFEKIANVTYANINNSSTSTAGYEDFTSITANVVRGQTNNITVTISNGYPEDVVLVWIDLNQDQDFDDAGELMYTSPMGAGPHTGPITIPLTATLGNTRMRVRLHDSTLGPNSTPCGNSTYGQVEDYTVNIQPGGYCSAGADGTGLGLDERIVNVTFANINNNSPNVTPTAPAYSDFTSIIGNVSTGQTYPIAVDVNRTGSNLSWAVNQVLVWIDFNQDFDFNDPGEQVFVSPIAAVDIYTGNVTIPVSASLGNTRMRIRLHDTHDGSQYTNNFNNTPCGLASYGEVEDYTLNIDIGSGAGELGTGVFGVFPNPNEGDFAVVYRGSPAVVQLELFDTMGRLVHSDRLAMSQGQTHALPLAGKLASGTYVLRLGTTEGTSEHRIVVR